MDRAGHVDIVPSVDGKRPGFVVVCLNCSYAHEVHAESGDDAVKQIAERHASGKHMLVARTAGG